MNGFLLLVPFFLIRFGFLTLLRKQAVRRATRFAQSNVCIVFFCFVGIALLTQSAVLFCRLSYFRFLLIGLYVRKNGSV